MYMYLVLLKYIDKKNLAPQKYQREDFWKQRENSSRPNIIE